MHANQFGQLAFFFLKLVYLPESIIDYLKKFSKFRLLLFCTQEEEEK